MTTTRPKVPRATRFPMNLPVRFRLGTDEGWSYGMTENISYTGILVRADRLIRPEASLDVEVVLPGDAEGTPRVVSRGSVTRAVAADEAGDQTLAIALDQSDIVRTSRGASR